MPIKVYFHKITIKLKSCNKFPKFNKTCFTHFSNLENQKICGLKHNKFTNISKIRKIWGIFEENLLILKYLYSEQSLKIIKLKQTF